MLDGNDLFSAVFILCNVQLPLFDIFVFVFVLRMVEKINLRTIFPRQMTLAKCEGTPSCWKHCYINAMALALQLGCRR